MEQSRAIPVDGRWLFAPVGRGTAVTWRWTVCLKSAAAGVAMPTIAALWPGFVRQGLEQLSVELLRS